MVRIQTASISGSRQWHFYIMLALVTLATYWPLTLGIYSLKNDALIYFLPWRFHISESIQNGHFPFWSPYLYTGLPLHSDMQSGTWNPVVLAISVLTRYNMQVLEWELLLYIFLSGAGLFKLAKAMGYTDTASFIAGTSYLCCGFITDSGSFISWITAAAYIPFVFLYFLRLLNKPSFAVSLKFSISLMLLFTAGSPSFFIYTMYVLLAVLTYTGVASLVAKKNAVRYIKYLLISAGLFFLLVLPAILSFADFLPYYRRGAGATLEEILTDPFNLFCSISYLFPSAVARPHEWFHTDVAMRNAYVGLFVVAFFFCSLFLPYTRLKKIIISITLFSFLFSLGDATPLRELCHKLLPLMNSFRHPAFVRIFTSIGIILVASQAIDVFFKGTTPGIKKNMQVIVFVIMTIIISFTGYYFLQSNSRILPSTTRGLKALLDDLTLPSLIFFQGIIQLLFIAFFFLFINSKKNIMALLILNVAFFAMTAQPFTLVSQIKTKTIDNYISSFPSGFPYPRFSDPVSVTNDSAFAVDFTDYNKFYTKKITIQDDIISPTVNTAYRHFLTDTVLLNGLNKLPFAYISSDNNQLNAATRLALLRFSPDCFVFSVTAEKAGYLNLFQQFHHNWKAELNGAPVAIEKGLIAFMKIHIPAGAFQVKIEYKPGSMLIISMCIACFLFILSIFYFLIQSFKQAGKANNESG